MTEISYTASLERNAQLIMDLVNETKTNYHNSVHPDVEYILEQIYRAAEEIKHESNRVEKSQKSRAGNRYPDRQ